MSKGTLLVLSGPSGVGKTTIAKKLREAGIPRVMTTTTRAPRGTEKNGVEYRFLSRAEFEAEIGRNQFLEYAEIDGNLYGTPKESIEKDLASRKVVLVDIGSLHDVGRTDFHDCFHKGLPRLPIGILSEGVQQLAVQVLPHLFEPGRFAKLLHLALAVEVEG